MAKFFHVDQTLDSGQHRARYINVDDISSLSPARADTAHTQTGTAIYLKHGATVMTEEHLPDVLTKIRAVDEPPKSAQRWTDHMLSVPDATGHSLHD